MAVGPWVVKKGRKNGERNWGNAVQGMRVQEKTNSSIGQMCVAVSGLLGWPANPADRAMANLSGGGGLSAFSLVYI